ncbi:MAG: error-prone DNA polymerase [Planctomycetota bacterium]|nr:MAG: error-prone DNA polymerase [Planctomycetota bacterium]
MRYAELHCRTNFSFLEGASHPDELAVRAAELGYGALAITDRNSLAGVVRAHGAAKKLGLKLIIGAELTPRDAARLVVWATDRASYGRLARLLTVGHRRVAKGECDLALGDVARHSAGLLAAVVPEAHEPLCSQGDLHAYRDLFGDRCYLLAEFHYGASDERRREELLRLSKVSRLPLAAAGDVHYHRPERMPLQHVLTAIRLGTTVAELGERRLPNAQRHLRSREELRAIFHDVPGAMGRTTEIADRCRFSLDELRYEYPEELAPPGETPMAYLRRLAWELAVHRYNGAIPAKVCRLLEHELALIETLRYEAFFLTVYDLVQFARSRGILCQGRGSAANSAVCYCLGVTAVDPNEHEMLFERFISQQRQEAPDIDVDFEHERREEVLQYLYGKYGRERAGLAATVITYRPRSAVRDVGKALGLSLDRVDALAKNVDRYGEDQLEKRCRQSGLDPHSRLGRQLVLLVNDLLGFPRHLSQHVGGMVITQGPLSELVPIENAAMADRTVIQWDKDDLDELGILKVDCLALGMLTAIRKCFELVERSTGRRLSLASIPADDKPVYEMICRADTVGVFQIESRAQMSMLPRLRPQRFYDLVIEVAIVRPGPIQGKMVHPYLRRRNGEEPVVYPSEEVRRVLSRTLGVPLFQEQAMQLAIVAAGFSPGEADQLRRAMAAWRRPGLIDEYRQRLIEGMLAKGYSQEFAEQLFEQIRGFGEYGFPESHAASFAKLAYVSSWLKHYYPAAFTAALINSQPMGFYAPAQLVRDAQAHGVTVLPVDVNGSDWDCTLEARGEGGRGGTCYSLTTAPCPPLPAPCPHLRLGLRMVRGFSEAHAQAIMAARTSPFTSVADLAARAALGRGAVKRLAEADAFGSLELHRRAALWQALDQTPGAEELPLFAALGVTDSSTPPLPKLSPQQEVYADYHAAGLSLRKHPVSFFREELDRLNIVPAEDLPYQRNGRSIKVAGLVLMRQRPGTAKGITFVTLEDETGIVNLIIHSHTWKKYEQAARRASALIAEGRLERKDEVIHVLVRRLEDLRSGLQELRHKSRDFR